MDSPTLQWLAEIGAIIASPTIVIAAIRALFVLGQWSQSLKSFAEFVETATERMDSHSDRIGRLEGAVDGVQRPAGGFPAYDRRSS